MRFVVQKSPVDYLYMHVHPQDGVIWVRDYAQANTYPSRYAAKNHLGRLDNIPDTARVLEVR